MIISGTRKIILISLIGLLGLVSIGLGISLGFAVAITRNIENTENFGEYIPALPTQILDINGNLITEFFGNEKREEIRISEMPKSLITALITREDDQFFKHNGFSIKGFSRAVFKIITFQYISGGSTLSQQVAGHLYADRTERSITRKIRELWMALQLERRLTKHEILEIYLNKMGLGHNTYGVEAASDFFFDHSATENTLAQNVMLVIQYVKPGLYSPYLNPESAKKIQRIILDQIVANGYATQEDADNSYILYWQNRDWTIDNSSTAYTEREDQAPYFSEYIRTELDNMLFGKQNIYTDGFVVHTSLNLEYQKIADEVISRNLHKWNRTYKSNRGRRMDFVNDEFVPLFDMLSLAFNIEDIRIAGIADKNKAIEHYEDEIVPTMDMMSLMFGMDSLKSLVNFSYNKISSKLEKSSVQTALITLENETGYITSMIGGSEFEWRNQINRAMTGTFQPASTFKPIYYSAAISSGAFTPASRFFDGPTVFWNPDGSAYTPMNYQGEWKGNVLLRTALANSMNIPSIKIMDNMGFDPAIERAAKLYGISNPVEINDMFPKLLTLALGVISVTPIQSARAYATFANGGRAVEPIAILYVTDKDGKTIVDNEREMRERQRELGDEMQILSPQAAYIMTDLLETTVKSGTLSRRTGEVGGFDGMAMAGKTGTTQNIEDAWAVGFSPYYTTVIWAGFDKKGNSLGNTLTGGRATGAAWAEYMKAIHKDLPAKQFKRPETGIVEVEIDAYSGLLPSEDSVDIITEIFISGTEPVIVDNYHSTEADRKAYMASKLLHVISTGQYDTDLDQYQNNHSNDRLLDGLDIELEFLDISDDDGDVEPVESYLD